MKLLNVFRLLSTLEQIFHLNVDIDILVVTCVCEILISSDGMEALKLFICDLYCKKTQESQAWLVPSQIKIENKTLLDYDYIDKEIGGRSCKCLVSFQYL